MRLIVTDDAVSKAGELVADALAVADARHGRARLAVPGGSALRAVAAARAATPAEVWARVHLTWVDERFVGQSDPASNRGALFAAMGDPGVAYTLPLVVTPVGWSDEIARVDAMLEERFGGSLDVALLGMGEDGHVASLFPGISSGGSGAPMQVHGRVAYVSASPKPPAERITLTREMLETAAHTIVLATGETKREALERLVRHDPALPATGLPGLVVVTDLRGIEKSGEST